MSDHRGCHLFVVRMAVTKRVWEKKEFLGTMLAIIERRLCRKNSRS